MAFFFFLMERSARIGWDEEDRDLRDDMERGIDVADGWGRSRVCDSSSFCLTKCDEQGEKKEEKKKSWCRFCHY